MKMYKFSVVEWVYNEDTKVFTVKLSVASQGDDNCDFVTVDVGADVDTTRDFNFLLRVRAFNAYEDALKLQAIKDSLSHLTFMSSISLPE
jgi:hypothetical protein